MSKSRMLVVALVGVFSLVMASSLENASGGNPLDEIILSEENGHFYEFVPGYLTWSQARDAAESRLHSGISGYLATITSQSEQSFIEQLLDGVTIPTISDWPQIWIGGSDAAQQLMWEWVTGPEAGTQFWEGDQNGSPVGGAYENWETLGGIRRQPDGAYGGLEDFLSIEFNVNPGSYPSDEKYQWNDSRGTRIGVGYLVEYSTLTVEVFIDIKPGSCPNPLNTKSKGVLPVAVLGTASFDITLIDPDTVSLEGVSPLRWALADAGTPFGAPLDDCLNCTEECGDGYMDLVLNFDRQEIVAALGEVSDGECLVLTLTGNLKEEFGSIEIIGEDVMLILKKGNQ